MRMQSVKHTKGWLGKMYIQRIEGGIFLFFLLLGFVLGRIVFYTHLNLKIGPKILITLIFELKT